jgi:hypothetical protein
MYMLDVVGSTAMKTPGIPAWTVGSLTPTDAVSSTCTATANPAAIPITNAIKAARITTSRRSTCARRVLTPASSLKGVG